MRSLRLWLGTLGTALLHCCKGCPRGPEAMSRQWARKESTTATHVWVLWTEWPDTRKGPQHTQPVLMLEQISALPGTNRQCPLLFPSFKKKELRNELLATFSPARMDDKGFPAIYGNVSCLRQVPKGGSPVLLWRLIHDLNKKFRAQNSLQGKKGEISYPNVRIPSGTEAVGTRNATFIFNN